MNTSAADRGWGQTWNPGKNLWGDQLGLSGGGRAASPPDGAMGRILDTVFRRPCSQSEQNKRHAVPQGLLIWKF